MIPVAPTSEPASFDDECRQPGIAWLAQHTGYNRPRDFWSAFEAELRAAFGGRCGWCAMLIMRGQVDHFIPIATLKSTGRDELAYEWRNLRYIDAWLNQKKRDSAVLDPFEVQDGWFEVILPSLQLRATNRLPAELHDIAEFTLQRLGLRDHEVIIRYRRGWFEKYTKGELALDGLRDFAPLIADAVERDLAKGIDWRR